MAPHALLAAQWQLQLVAHVRRWACTLEAAHPALQGLPLDLPLLAVALYRRYLLAAAGVAALCLHDSSALAACLWLALKFHGQREALPGSSFMAQITGERGRGGVAAWEVSVTPLPAVPLQTDSNGVLLLLQPAAAFNWRRLGCRRRCDATSTPSGHPLLQQWPALCACLGDRACPPPASPPC